MTCIFLVRLHHKFRLPGPINSGHLVGRLENFIFSHQNRLRQWALRWNWAFYIPFQSCNSIHPRKFKYCGVFFIAEVEGVTGARMGSTTPNVLWLDTKTESEDEFDIHNCAFEVAFNECTQLYIQWFICTHRVEFHLIQFCCAWHGAYCSISPKRSLRMERLSSNLQ